MRTASIKDLPLSSDFSRTDQNLVLDVFYFTAPRTRSPLACRLPFARDVHAQMLHRFTCAVGGFHDPGDGARATELAQAVNGGIEHELRDPRPPDLGVDIGASQPAKGRGG